jgi:PAS domain S-box-containing protein
MADDKYRLLFEASADAIFLTAPDGTIFDANPAATEMFGLSRDEFCRGGRDAILVRDAAFSRALEQRERIGRTSSELTYRRKDGSVFVGETMSVMLPPEGGQTRAFAVVRDVTARRRAEDALRERNEYIEAILEQAPIGFAVHTLDGVARFVSRRFEAIYGVPAGSILSLEDYFDKVYRDPAFREEIRERMVTDVAAGDPARMRWEHLPIVSESGERRYVTAVNIPLPELKEWYGRAEIFWHFCGLGQSNPAHVEHFGMSTVEAMQNGCLPIVFDGGGQREIVENGVSGFRFAGAGELRELTLRAIADPRLRQRLARAARLRGADFSRAVFATQVRDLFRGLAAEYASGKPAAAVGPSGE